MKFIDNKAVAERLKKLREDINLSSRQFALRAGLDPSHYNKVEKGLLEVTEPMIEKIASEYDIPQNGLLYGVNIPRETKNKEDGQGTQNIEALIQNNSKLADANLINAQSMSVLIQILKSKFGVDVSIAAKNESQDDKEPAGTPEPNSEGATRITNKKNQSAK